MQSLRSAFCRGRSLHASKQRQQQQQQQAQDRAPADRSTASVVLVAGGGTARLLAEAGSCLASSFAGAEAEGIRSEL